MQIPRWKDRRQGRYLCNWHTSQQQYYRAAHHDALLGVWLPAWPRLTALRQLGCGVRWAENRLWVKACGQWLQGAHPYRKLYRSAWTDEYVQAGRWHSYRRYAETWCAWLWLSGGSGRSYSFSAGACSGACRQSWCYQRRKCWSHDRQYAQDYVGRKKARSWSSSDWSVIWR